MEFRDKSKHKSRIGWRRTIHPFITAAAHLVRDTVAIPICGVLIPITGLDALVEI
jgi:hypothetical protein